VVLVDNVVGPVVDFVVVEDGGGVTPPLPEASRKRAIISAKALRLTEETASTFPFSTIWLTTPTVPKL
jgi:hypothetical protein